MGIKVFNADFYPRSPCGERHLKEQEARCKLLISIHALLAESDDTSGATHRILRAFLSTLSLRRATLYSSSSSTPAVHFYPRSPCGERLRQHSKPDSGRMNFYPRSPCGERLRQNYECFRWIKFLSTLSLRRATYDGLIASANFCHFYPRSPCGERHTWARGSRVTYVISIHALLAESDLMCTLCCLP